ncbi:UNVERIFIED_CONTAM: HxlR family transcriptional regulator [Acetivibrio alkalicellulosi]
MENPVQLDAINEDYCIYELLGPDKISKGLWMISGKWKLKLLYIIGYNEVLRYGEIKRQAAPITHKMLSSQLKELERDQLIIRKEYAQIPPKVEYALSERGMGLIPMFNELFNWMLKYDV